MTVSGIDVSNVSKSFGTTRVLRDVSLKVASGEFISLVGPSGCGKTTLMRIIAGLEMADAGTIQLRGDDVTHIRAADRDVAMVFQNYALYPHLSVRQNMAVPLVMRRLTAAQRLPLIGRSLPGAKAQLETISDDIARTADLLGIGALLDRKPAQLSGGQRQRVALGRAIVRKPHAFLMDEPLSNLDAALRVTTRTEIVALHKRVGASTVYVTHDQSEAMTMSDRVAVMMAGEILQIGTPEEIYTNPLDLRVARFIGSPMINTLPAEVGGDGAVRVSGTATGLSTTHRGPVTMAVRPEDMIPAERGIACQIEHVEFLGDCILVHARHEETGLRLLSRLQPDQRREAIAGRMIHFGLSSRRALLFDAQGRRVATHAHRPVAAHG